MGASSLRVGVLFSGGKDSTYTIWVLQHQGWEIPVLVTVQPRRPESFIFHYPGIESTSLQSKALGIDQVFIREETSGLDELQDRKSTRLNSSHVRISYAVFCLKKKKIKTSKKKKSLSDSN